MNGTGSTQVVIKEFPESPIVCLDLFQSEPKLQGFINNTWEGRHNVRAIAGKTCDTLPFLHSTGFQPAVVWVDAGHEEQEVYEDVTSILEYFPAAIVGGDDWSTGNWGPKVQAAIYRIIEEGLVARRYVGNNGRAWFFTNRLSPHERCRLLRGVAAKKETPAAQGHDGGLSSGVVHGSLEPESVPPA
jgi:hypothetical protein